MAAQKQVWVGEGGRRAALYLITGLNSGDAIDFSPDFAKVLDVHIHCITKDPPFTVNFVIAVASVTLTNAFLANDAVYALVVGAAK
jgi:hypothetical protein